MEVLQRDAVFRCIIGTGDLEAVHCDRPHPELRCSEFCPAPIQIRRPLGLVRLRIGLVNNRTGNREKAIIPAKLEGFDPDRVACPIVGNVQDAAIDHRGMLFIEGRENPAAPQLDLGFGAEKLTAVADVEARFAANRQVDKLHGIDGRKVAPECARNDVVHGRRNGVELLARAIDCAEGLLAMSSRRAEV